MRKFLFQRRDRDWDLTELPTGYIVLTDRYVINTVVKMDSHRYVGAGL